MTFERLNELRKLAKSGGLSPAEQLELIEAVELLETTHGCFCCSYCNANLGVNTDPQINEKAVQHMATCEKHPVSKLLRHIEALEKELAEWRAMDDGAWAPEALEKELAEWRGRPKN